MSTLSLSGRQPVPLFPFSKTPTDMTDSSFTSARRMRATAIHRETVDVHDGENLHSARCSARLTRDLQADNQELACGDWVLCTVDEHQQLWVHTRVAPRNQIVRRDANGSRHTVVSNVDTALLVMGLDLDFNLQRLERYLAMVVSSGVQPVVVLTKADIAGLSSPDAVQQRVDQVHARVGAHIDVVAVDARTPHAQQALAPYLGDGQTLVLLGSSGAGKSTLTNRLLGADTQDTGAVREHDSRGKHTTTARSLHQLPTGACVIDTPGVRTLRPDVDPHTLGRLFEDVGNLAAQCRFRNCSHQDEPGCAVRSAVDPQRLKNYQKLLRETLRDSTGALDRQSQLAEWKSRTRASRQRKTMERG
jgi:ribosome biogenesis GTPase